MARTVEIPAASDEPLGKFRRWAQMKRLSEELAKDANNLKTQLTEWVKKSGYADDKGSLWVDLETPIEGYSAVQYQRRVAQPLDPDVAEELIAQRGLEDRCYKTVRVLDETEIMACIAEGVLTAEDVDAMFPPKVTWAFVPTKK